MIDENKTRITITIGKEVLEKLEKYCIRLGITKSAYIAYIVATTLDTQEQLMQGVTSGMVDAATTTDMQVMR